MKGSWRKVAFIGLFFLVAGISIALSETPTPIPTTVPVNQGSPSPVPSVPSPAPAPLRAPLSAPTSAGIDPNHPNPKQASPWMSLEDLGAGIPLSGSLQGNYGAAFNADAGTGLKLSDRLSLWLDLGLDTFGANSGNSGGSGNFTMVSVSLSLKFRFTTGGLNPYIFAGPGLAYNEIRNTSTLQYDPTTGYTYIPITAYEFDFFAQGGAGLEIGMGGGLDLFLQAKVVGDFTSTSFANRVSIDSPTLATQIEMGTLFGI